MTDVPANHPRRRAQHVWRATRPYVNATLVLAIGLVLVGLWLVNSARSLVDDTMNDVKFGEIQELDNDAKALVEELRVGLGKVDALRLDISRITEHPSGLINPEIRNRLNAVDKAGNRIAVDLNRITSGHLDLSQETLEKLAISLVRVYGQIRGCNSPAASATTQRR